MVIRTVTVTPFMQNCRVVIDESAGTATVIDPGGDLPHIVRAIAAPIAGRGSTEPVRLTRILLTHAHIDHAGGVAALLRQVSPRPELLAHRADAPLRASIRQQALMMGLSPAEYENCPEPDVLLEQGDRVGLCHCQANVDCKSTVDSEPKVDGEATVLFVPGHAPGHIAFFVPAVSRVRLQTMSADGAKVDRESVLDGPVLFGGDALFQGSIGRTDLPGGDTAQLLDSIRTQLMVLPDETRVLSGHGPDTSIGVERESNPFVGRRSAAGGW